MPNYFDVLNKLLENIENIHITDELVAKFKERTLKHISLVNKYAEKIGKSFPEHDSSKLGDLLEPYSLFMKEDKSTAEEELLDLATLIHIRNASHHPEFWTDTNLEGFKRKNPNPHGIIDATQMSNDALEEMCADWCSMSEEFKNSPMDWFNKVNGTRWLFSSEQQRFIRETLLKMWN